MKEVRAESLLGTIVVDVNGERVGRIEEIAVTLRDGEMYVENYVAGVYGLASRMSASSSLHWMARLLGAGVPGGHIIPWDRMDLTDPEHPVTTCAKNELKRR